MKICYIISTCDKYLDSRVKYQMDIMLKNVNKEDIYYLTSQPDIKNRQFGWYCMDDEKNITLADVKYYQGYEVDLFSER
jgi:hypothetical protein